MIKDILYIGDGPTHCLIIESQNTTTRRHRYPWNKYRTDLVKSILPPLLQPKQNDQYFANDIIECRTGKVSLRYFDLNFLNCMNHWWPGSLCEPGYATPCLSELNHFKMFHGLDCFSHTVISDVCDLVWYNIQLILYVYMYVCLFVNTVRCIIKF